MSAAEQLQGAFLDWAGTTIDFGSRAPTQVFVEIFRQRGIDLSETEARGPMGRAKREHIAELLALPRVAEQWRAQFGVLPGKSEVDSLYATFLPLQRTTLARCAELIPGTIEAVAACRAAGLRVAATTGYTRELMQILAPLAAQAGYEPELTICADDVARGRPAPWMLLHAAEQLELFPLHTLLVVDDTPVGIEAGRAAGMWCVALAGSGNALGYTHSRYASLPRDQRESLLNPIRRDFLQRGAHFVIDTIADLPPLLPEINRRLAAGDRPQSAH